MVLTWQRYANKGIDKIASESFFKAVNFSALNELSNVIAEEPKLTKILTFFLQVVADIRSESTAVNNY
jgi:hypothetical protein